MRRRVQAALCQRATGMWVDMEGLMSNMAETACMFASTCCAAPLATWARKLRCSTASRRSVPLRPRESTMSCSLRSTISHEISSGFLLKKASFFFSAGARETFSKPSSTAFSPSTPSSSES